MEVVNALAVLRHELPTLALRHSRLNHTDPAMLASHQRERDGDAATMAWTQHSQMADEEDRGRTSAQNAALKRNKKQNEGLPEACFNLLQCLPGLRQPMLLLGVRLPLLCQLHPPTPPQQT